jgi:hypothetical protein
VGDHQRIPAVVCFFADFHNLLVELVELVDCTPYVESKAAESARPPNLITSEYLLLYVFAIFWPYEEALKLLGGWRGSSDGFVRRPSRISGQAEKI